MANKSFSHKNFAKRAIIVGHLRLSKVTLCSLTDQSLYKNMNLKKLIFGIVITALLPSCSSKRNALTYFDDIDAKAPSISINDSDYLSKICPDDELLITVTSSVPELTAMYNLPLTNPATAKDGLVTATSLQQATYRVNSKGDISLPELGVLHVSGMTVEQLEEKITAEVRKSVTDATVIVRLVNFTVNVAGEVTHPGAYPVTRERFSVLDALSAAGDLTPYGERSNILLIREEDGKRTSHRLDLNSADLLSSPYFYVKQNDYIYVEPNMIRSDNSKYNQNNAFKLSVISTVVSACSVVASLVIALAIK